MDVFLLQESLFLNVWMHLGEMVMVGSRRGTGEIRSETGPRREFKQIQADRKVTSAEIFADLRQTN